MIRAVGALVLAACVLAACGGDDDPDVAGALASALRSGAGFGREITPTEADCVGESLVEDLGEQEAAAVGRTGGADADGVTDGGGATLDLAELSSEETTALGAAMERCVDDLDSLVVEVLADGFRTGPDAEIPVGETEASCIGEAVAGQIPYARLLSLGLDAGDDDQLRALDGDELDVLARAYADCVDVRALVTGQVAANGASAETVACLEREISDADVEALFVAAFTGAETSAEEVFVGPVLRCG